MKKILVARYETIGDTIFASAFYRELRKALPDAQIDAVADRISRPIMEQCPYINNIIDIPSNSKKYLYYFKFLKLLKHYDTVYCLKNNHFISKLAFLAGIKNRIGFKERKRSYKYLNITCPYNEDKHEIDCYLDLLRITNIPVNNNKTECWFNSAPTEKVKDYLSVSKGIKKVIIQAYSRDEKKDWFDEYWIKVIKHLSNNLDIQVYFAGGIKDREKYENLKEKLVDITIKPINTSGELSITETMQLIKNMDLLIGIDSGLSHIAAALNIKQLFLHGPTSLDRWEPRSENCTILTKNFSCSPCALQTNKKAVCNGKKTCMRLLTPDLVINESDKILKKNFITIPY